MAFAAAVCIAQFGDTTTVSALCKEQVKDVYLAV
jgi:hypothetical protein